MKKSHDFEGATRVAYWKVWREEKEGRNKVIFKKVSDTATGAFMAYFSIKYVLYTLERRFLLP